MVIFDMGSKEHQRQRQLLDLHIRSAAVSHAYLFTGPRHTGKMDAAYRAAASLLCEKRPAGILAACGTCTACGMHAVHVPHAARTHPDIIVCDTKTRETASLRLADIKSVRSRVAASPHGRAHMIILRDAACMTREAANALLKVLEEPAAATVFFLLAENMEDVPGTIRSRAWHIRFWPTMRAAKEHYFSDGAEQDYITSLIFGTAADRLQYAEKLRDQPEQMRAWYTKASVILADKLHMALTGPEAGRDAVLLARLSRFMAQGEAQFLKPYATKRILFESHLLY